MKKLIEGMGLVESKKLLLMLGLGICVNVFSQSEQSYTGDMDNQPEWVQLMYKDNADFGEVSKAFDLYYSTHKFVKNGHTQYFKRWLRDIEKNSDGPISDAQKSATNNYLKKRNNTKKTTGTSWVGIGPYDYDEDAGSMSYAAGTAHVYTVEQSQSNTNVLYAGTATAGLWKSTDKGQNWLLKTKDLMLRSVYAIEIDPSDENIVYMGAQDGRLWKTVNGGDTWTELNVGSFYQGAGRIQDIALNPNDNSVLYVLTKDGYYRSTDAGINFSLLFTGEYQEIEFNPSNDNMVYVVKYNSSTTRTEFYKSTDGGVTFTQKSTGWPSTGEQKRTEIAVSAANSNKVYAYCTGSVNGGSGTYGMYVSTDMGESWTFQCCGVQPGGAASASNKNLMGWSDAGTDDGGQYYYDMALGVMPSDQNKLFVGGVNLWHSSDGGQDFYCPSKWSHSTKPQYVHADIHDIKIYGDDIWVACDGGIWYSNDAGVTFDKRFRGIEGTDFWGFGLGYGKKGHRVMVGGAYHNGTQLMDNDVYNEGWAVVHGGDGVGGHVSPVDDRIYHGQNGTQKLPGIRTGALSAVTFTKQPNNDYPLGKYSNVKYHPRVYNTVFVGEGNSLWKSTNNGVTFTELYNFGEHVADFEVSEVNPDVMTVATYVDYWGAKKLFRTTNGGTSWIEITLPAGLDIKLAAPYDVTLSSSDENEMWVAKLAHTSNYSYELNGYKIFKSNNGGATWVNLTTATLDDEKIRSIVHQAGTDGGVYIGTARTVYYRNNTDTDWQIYADGLPAETPCLKLLPDYYGGKVINATSRSVYEADFLENVAPIANFMVSSQNTACNGVSIGFIDQSSVNEVGLTRAWEFEGGIASSTTDASVNVSYPLPGTYDVTLTVTDVNGSHSVTYTDFITVTGSCTSTLDLSVLGIENVLENISCSNNSFQPSLKIQNNGTVDITSFEANVYVNGDVVSQINETTNLTTGEIQLVDLGQLNSVYNLKVVITSVNGVLDNTSNNEIVQSFDFPEIANSSYTVVSATSEETAYADRSASFTLDGDINTFWHSRWSNGNDPMPYEIVYDLGDVYHLTKMNMINRQNNSNGYLNEVEIFVSEDGTNWGVSTVANFVSSLGQQSVALTGKKGRYVKLVINSTLSGDNVASIAELSFEGCLYQVNTSFGAELSPKIAVYPNPFKEEITLKGIDSEASVEIYNLLGEKVGVYRVFQDTRISTSNYKDGVYLVKISSAKGVKTIKLYKSM